MEFVGITVLFLDEKIPIHMFTLAGRANHYMSSLKAGSIVKIDRFEVSSAQMVGKICSIRGSPHQRNNSSRYPPPH
ncbi:hypothetical protein Bca52824_013605 [Brassica carinata]|uniref:Uncharacterized protein n=1 Tax=Brassica carinata TaxID=52824 RepID=A0A8X8B3L7_BRACI|nr:hypothetical protein Bca52824_013605 [Brassica carinata]